MSAHILYRLFSSDSDLLYIGITLNPPARFRHHRGRQAWWSQVETITLEHFCSRAELEEAEKAAIRNEVPRWNGTRFTDKRRRRPAPTVDLSAARAALGISVADIQDRFEAESGRRPSAEEVTAFEAGRVTDPVSVADFSVAYRLPVQVTA